MRRLIVSLVALAWLALAGMAAADAPRRVEHALIKRGFDYANVNCDQTRPARCSFAGRYRTPNGALRRCSGRATVYLRGLRFRGQRCEQIAPAPPWPAVGFNNANGFDEHDFALAQEAGATTNRLVAGWSGIERERGVYDWTQLDLAYQRTLAIGAPPLITVMSAPEWAQAPHPPCTDDYWGCTYPPAPEFAEDWKRFVQTVAVRYPQAIGMEVWNEPNWGVFWAPAPDPEAYADLVTQTDRAVAEVAPDLPVLFGGPIPTYLRFPDLIPPDQFLRRAYRRGLSYDVLGAHSYPFPTSPEGSVLRASREQLQPLLDVAAEFDQHPEMWITEIGVSTGGGRYVGTSEAGQAQALTELYREARRTRRVPVFIVHTLRDFVDNGTNPWGDHLGIRWVDDTPKLAFCALALVRQLPCGEPAL